INVGQSPYRYQVLYGKAVEFAGAVASLGQSLLSCFEKADGESLSELRQKHEVATQNAVLEVRKEQLAEARENLDVTRRSLLQAQARFNYYSSREAINVGEQTGLGLASASQVASLVGQQL